MASEDNEQGDLEMTEGQSVPVTNLRRLVILVGVYGAVIAVLCLGLGAWCLREISQQKKLEAEFEDILSEKDPRHTLLKSLEGQLQVKFTEEYLANTRIPYALGQFREPDRFPIRDGSEIVACLDDPTEADGRYGRLKAGEFIRLLVYVPAGNNKLIHGFKCERGDKSLPERVVHNVDAGQVHEVQISVRSENNKTLLVIVVDPESSSPETNEYSICDANSQVTFDRRGIWCHWMMPNEQLGWCSAFAGRISAYGGWRYQSDLPNTMLRLDVSIRKDGNSQARSFSLRFGVQSDSPESVSALVVASRSKDFVKRISEDGARWKSPSDGQRAIRAVLPDGPLQWFFGGTAIPEVVPTIEEIFEPADGSDHLIFRKGWAEKTLEPW